jgi:hypothetical protein
MCAEVGGFEGMRRCAEGEKHPFVIVVRPESVVRTGFLAYAYGPVCITTRSLSTVYIDRVAVCEDDYRGIVRPGLDVAWQSICAVHVCVHYCLSGSPMRCLVDAMRPAFSRSGGREIEGSGPMRKCRKPTLR